MEKSLSNLRTPINRHATPSLLIVGSVAFDSIKTPFGEIEKALGGSASYFSLAASQFCRPAVVGVVGDDFGPAEERILADKNIDVSGIERASGKTFAWGGEYSFDLNNRTTLFTHLNVFENFQPKLSEQHKKSEYVFLGNIHPLLQLEVLSQISEPKFVGLDTMNYWIEKAPKDLQKVLKQVDCLIINDSEARQLSGEANLIKAAKKILATIKTTSPRNKRESPALIIKRGEYGILMFKESPKKISASPLGKLEAPRNDTKSLAIFHLPGYPLENVIDPTGAGDSFAGGFMGFLAKNDGLSFENLKRACVYGSVLASFCCEHLGTERLQKLNDDEINERYQIFKTLTHFELV